MAFIRAFTRASGKMTNEMAPVLIFITNKTARSTTMAIGLMISAMVRVKCFTGTSQFMMASGNKILKLDLDDSICQMGICIKDTGKMENDMDKENITFNQEDKCSKEPGPRVSASVPSSPKQPTSKKLQLHSNIQS